MRIGIYNPRVGFAESGGTETFLREIMKRLAPAHEIILYTGDRPLLDEINQMDVRVERISLQAKETTTNQMLSRYTPVLPAEVESASMYANARRRGLFDRMADEVDVVSTHYYLDNLLVSRRVDVPTLFRFPGIKQPSPRWKAMVRFARPDSYLANSEATATRLQEWLNLDTDGTVYAGVDVEQFSPEVAPAFQDDRVTVLYVGRLDEGKGLHELVDAQSRLGDATDLYLVGNGTLRSDLEDQVRDLEIGEYVHFVGSVSHDEIQRYYAAANIFCLPSHHESLGIVNLEAMATGTPVITTRIDAIEEYIDDGKNGILVSPENIDALTEALGRLASDTALRERLAESGRATAAQFSWAAQAREMEAHYARIVDR